MFGETGVVERPVSGAGRNVGGDEEEGQVFSAAPRGSIQVVN